MWHLFQILIMFAVMASNIHWKWTPNGYLASAIGIGLALLITLILNEIIELLSRKKGRTER